MPLASPTTLTLTIGSPTHLDTVAQPGQTSRSVLVRRGVPDNIADAEKGVCLAEPDRGVEDTTR